MMTRNDIEGLKVFLELTQKGYEQLYRMRQKSAVTNTPERIKATENQIQRLTNSKKKETGVLGSKAKGIYGTLGKVTKNSKYKEKSEKIAGYDDKLKKLEEIQEKQRKLNDSLSEKEAIRREKMLKLMTDHKKLAKAKEKADKKVQDVNSGDVYDEVHELMDATGQKLDGVPKKKSSVTSYKKKMGGK